MLFSWRNNEINKEARTFMKDFLKNKTTIKRIAMVLLFFAINFGLWEIIAPMVSGEWASLNEFDTQIFA